MTAQELRSIVMLASAAITALSPEAGEFVQENAEAVAATVMGAWGLIAGWQAWRKRKEAKA